MAKFWMQQRARADKTRRLRAQLAAHMQENHLWSALRVLQRLERIDPLEPRWPCLQGNLQRKVGDDSLAAAAYVRATYMYEAAGRKQQASAMAKTLLLLDCTRMDVLADVDPVTARRFTSLTDRHGAARPDLALDRSAQL